MFTSVSTLGVPSAHLCGIAGASHACILCLKLRVEPHNHGQLPHCSMQLAVAECDFILPNVSSQEMRQGAAVPPQAPI